MKDCFVKRNKIFGVNILYLLSLLPVVIFAFYKNGILVFNDGHFNFFLALQYLIIPIIIVVLSYVFEIYYYMCVKKEENTYNVVNSIVPYINLLCYLITGPMDKLYITIPLIVLLDIIMKFLDSKISVNRVALFKCLLFGILSLLSMYNNANLSELAVTGEYSNFKLFLGMGVGEIATTSTLFALVGYIILLFNSYYKKDIPIACFIGYCLVGLLLYYSGVINFNQLLVNTFNSGFVFAIVFVASLSVATPVVRSGRIIYGLVVGSLSAIAINLLDFNMGVYFVILVLSLLTSLLNKFKLSID